MAEAATTYWRVRMKFSDAIDDAQHMGIPEGSYHPIAELKLAGHSKIAAHSSHVGGKRWCGKFSPLHPMPIRSNGSSRRWTVATSNIPA
jgi:hypothetical protein